MSVDWGYFDKFEWADEKYLPCRGEGETKATQIVTAISKLVYKWYNDGDVFDNTHYLVGWWNDLSSYANWLEQHTDKASDILHKISKCYDYIDYMLTAIEFEFTDAELAELRIQMIDKWERHYIG